ncbi:hypothetical protein SELMODRAFT_427211 [Selaginella moellendorffii]|uniref:Bifunctional inhibitor/plant lipid transfer protein/seed storage helical domain-containing protein n=2 Tax=Selaginella moellendorffii TaxID=88036 RepID=D8SYW0_SELML|nr:hypothetical protein SELMODRAFT_427211 [Selaginella moellendorffii]
MAEDSEEECGAPDDNRLQSCFVLHSSRSKARKDRVVSRLLPDEPECCEQWRKDAFDKFWRHVESVVESTLEDGNADCFSSIEQWICNSQFCKEQIKLYSFCNASSSRLSSALLFSGSVDSSDTHAIFDGLCSHLQKQNRCRVARLQPHLLLGKHGVNSPLRSLFKQFTGITPETTDMEILAAWHQESCNEQYPLVVIVEDAEHSHSSVLAELVVILSEWAAQLPLVLIMGMAMTEDSLQMMLPASVTGRLHVHSFYLKSPLHRLEAVVQAVLIDLPFVFTWGTAVVKDFYEFFYSHDNTVTSFLRLLKVSCMEHFSKQPLSFLCVNLVDSTSQVEFEKFCKKLPSAHLKYASILSPSQGDDISQKIAAALWSYKANRRCWSMAFQCFLAAGLHMNFKFADVYYGALTSSKFSAVVKDENVLSLITERMKYLAVSTMSELLKEWTLLTSHNGQCSKDLEALRKQLSSTDPADVAPPLQSSFCGTPSMTTRRMRALMGCSSPPGVSHCNDPKPTEQPKGDQKAKSMRMAMEFLERLQRDYIVAPESIPFHDVFCFKDVNALKQAMTGETRKRVHSDLLSSQATLKCECCPSNGSPAFSLHDTALAYALSLEHNELVNVHDWYQSFEFLHSENKSAETSRKRGAKRKVFSSSEGEIPKPAVASIQARFCKAVAELHVTGLLRLPKKRRPDSVQRISIGFSSESSFVRRASRKMKRISMLLVVAVMAIAMYGASADYCDLTTLLPCLSSVIGDKPTPPSEECCAVVRVVDPDCVCGHVGDDEGITGINVKLAAQIPKKCGRHVPKGFKCGDVPVPS